MKIILACQIFSQSAAAAMRFYVERSQMPSEALQTAQFLETVNAMWDFVDSHYLNALLGKKPVTAKDFDLDMARFQSFIEFAKTWKFMKNNKVTHLPSHKGWILCLSAMMQLCIELIQEKSS